MTYLLNAAYLCALLVSSPWLVYKALTTGKYRRGLWSKFLGRAHLRAGNRPCAWFHGVSVGEIHLLQQVVSCFREHHPDWDCVVSTTTDTGFVEAQKRFADLPVCYWPLDFSWAVRRALRNIRPSLVVLAEGELWPNFLMAARERGVAVAVVNARMSPRSFRRYRCIRGLLRRLLGAIDLFAVQSEEYASLFRALGVSLERIQVTDSVKYDGVTSDRKNPRTEVLRRLLRVDPYDVVWVAGSTQAPEEEIVLNVFGRARRVYPNLRLFLVPRQKERFDEVAVLLQRRGEPFQRRSTLSKPLADPKTTVLVDTIGELGALWGLADLAFVGGSLDGRRGGQNMIEPAAYGAAVLFGPHVWNFRETAARLISAGGAIQVADAADLESDVMRLLSDPNERRQLGIAAYNLVRMHQGATERTIDCLDRLLATRTRAPRAA
jgi:3-deoxy-D-manno-octulosonic-acid transferase